MSESTPDSADSITTFVMLYKYGLADNPDILKGLSSSWKTIEKPVSKLSIFHITFNKSAANFKTLLATISSFFFSGFCSICRYKFICSVISTDRFLYFLFILVPKVIKRKSNTPKPKHQIMASKLYCECKPTVS